MPSASRPVGAIESYSLSAASAYQRNALIDSGRSASRQSVIGLPASSESSSASSSAFSSMRSARRSITALRSAGERRDQRPSSNARRAARTASSISAASPAATSARSRPVAGSSVANRSPLSAGRKAPSMKASVRNVGRAAMTTTPPHPASGRRMIRAAVGSARPGHQPFAVEHRRHDPPAEDVGERAARPRGRARGRGVGVDDVERDERCHDDRREARRAVLSCWATRTSLDRVEIAMPTQIDQAASSGVKSNWATMSGALEDRRRDRRLRRRARRPGEERRVDHVGDDDRRDERRQRLAEQELLAADRAS